MEIIMNMLLIIWTFLSFPPFYLFVLGFTIAGVLILVREGFKS